MISSLCRSSRALVAVDDAADVVDGGVLVDQVVEQVPGGPGVLVAEHDRLLAGGLRGGKHVLELGEGRRDLHVEVGEQVLVVEPADHVGGVRRAPDRALAVLGAVLGELELAQPDLGVAGVPAVRLGVVVEGAEQAGLDEGTVERPAEVADGDVGAVLGSCRASLICAGYDPKSRTVHFTLTLGFAASNSFPSFLRISRRVPPSEVQTLRVVSGSPVMSVSTGLEVSTSARSWPGVVQAVARRAVAAAAAVIKSLLRISFSSSRSAARTR